MGKHHFKPANGRSPHGHSNTTYGGHAISTQLAFLMGSRGSLSAEKTPVAKAPKTSTTVVQSKSPEALANAKARQQRKKHRRYERQKEAHEQAIAEAPASEPPPRKRSRELVAEADGETDEVDDERGGGSRPPGKRVKTADDADVPFPLRAVPSKAERRKAIKKAKKEMARTDAPSAAAAAAAASQAKSPRGDGKGVQTSLKYGVRIQELIRGTGPVVQDRGRVRVAYVGRLDQPSGAIFDRSSGLTFRLGRGEVIKGWDEGVKGMRIGEQRRIIVPPKAGYGAQRAPGIPPNSTLCFDVTVLSG